MRLVLTGTPATLRVVTAADLPADKNLRSAYFEWCDLSGLDLTPYDMTDAGIVHSDVPGLKLPGIVAPVGQTRNHGLYMRFNTGVKSLVLPPYIPWDCHEMVTALFLQRLARPGGATTRRAILNDIAAWVPANEYRQSWQPAWSIYSTRYSPTAMDLAVTYVCANHPELLAHWEEAKALPLDAGLVTDRVENLPGGLKIDAAFVGSLGLAHLHDRWELARYLESYLPQFFHLDIGPGFAFRVHVWSVTPFQWTYAISDTDDWWLARFGG